LMAGPLLRLGDLQQAQACALRAIEAAQAVRDERGTALSLQVAGQVSLSLGDWETAIEAFRRAVELFRTIPLRMLVAPSLDLLGRAYLLQGDQEAAADCFREALALASQSELGGTIHWPIHTLVANPLVAEALSGLEEMHQDSEAFRALCHCYRSRAADGPFVEWSLDPANVGAVRAPLGSREPLLRETFADSLSPEWTWHDAFGDCTYALRDGLEIRAANGRDLLNVNLSAPRLLRVAAGDWVIQTQCAPVSGSVPAIGGLVLWRNKENYLRLDRGAIGERDIYFGG
jgi:tetratricopeptide (TPR) repeat protein